VDTHVVLLHGHTVSIDSVGGARAGEPILGVMAKKIEGKEKLWDKGFLAMDLADISENPDRLQL
jgi:hypothetical protein